MSKEAIRTFFEAADRNKELREKIAALREQNAATLAEDLAALSAEADSPIPVGEWQLFLEKASTGELADQDLQAIAGGFPKVTIQPR